MTYSTTKFRAGDWVRCVDNSYGMENILKVGNLYRITRVLENNIMVAAIPSTYCPLASRFVPASHEGRLI